MAATKEAGQTARTLVSVFRREPLVLALILMNFALLGLLYWNSVIAERERSMEMQLLYENRKYVGDLLARCYPSPPSSGG